MKISTSALYGFVALHAGLTHTHTYAWPFSSGEPVYSEDGHCGPQHGNTVCKTGCCSRWGWCGNDPRWCSCEAGCSEESGGRCGFPVDHKPFGQHFCSVPEDLAGKFNAVFPEVRHNKRAKHNALGSDIKKVVRALDDGFSPISAEGLLTVAEEARKKYPNLSWREFSAGLMALHHFFPGSNEESIIHGVENFAANFNHPDFHSVCRDLVVFQTATHEEHSFHTLVQQVNDIRAWASHHDSSINISDLDNLAEAVGSLGFAFEHFSLADLLDFMKKLDQNFTKVSIDELSESVGALKEMAGTMPLSEMADNLDRFAKDWGHNHKMSLEMLCDVLTTIHLAYDHHSDLGGTLTSLMLLKRTFARDANKMKDATLPWLKKEMIRLQHGTGEVPDTFSEVTDAVVAIKKEVYHNNATVSLPHIVEYILIMYGMFGKHEPTLKSLIQHAKESAKVFQRYRVGTVADDPFFDAHALALFAHHFGQTQDLPLGEVKKTFEQLHSRFNTATIPSMCRDLITLQYSGDNLSTIVTDVEKVFDHNKATFTDMPALNFDDIAAGFRAVKGHGSFQQNVQQYLSSGKHFWEFVQDHQDNLHGFQLGAPGQEEPPPGGVVPPVDVHHDSGFHKPHHQAYHTPQTRTRYARNHANLHKSRHHPAGHPHARYNGAHGAANHSIHGSQHALTGSYHAPGAAGAAGHDLHGSQHGMHTSYHPPAGHPHGSAHGVHGGNPAAHGPGPGAHHHATNHHTNHMPHHAHHHHKKKGHSIWFWLLVAAVIYGIYYFWPKILAEYNARKFAGQFDNIKYSGIGSNLGFELPNFNNGFDNVESDDEDSGTSAADNGAML